MRCHGDGTVKDLNKIEINMVVPISALQIYPQSSDNVLHFGPTTSLLDRPGSVFHEISQPMPNHHTKFPEVFEIHSGCALKISRN